MKLCKSMAAVTGMIITMALGHETTAALFDVPFGTPVNDVYTASWSGPQTIPDNTDSGLAFNLNFGTTGLQISDVSVTLNISGGWNGDLYGYLSHGDGIVVLLNRVGNGDFGTSGFNNITLHDDIAGGSPVNYANIHDVQSPTANGTYNPDSPVTFFTAFGGKDPSGTWTLLFADKEGTFQSTLTSWSVDVTAVPEPTTWAAIIFGSVFIGTRLFKNHKVKVRHRRISGYSNLEGQQST